jgi:hypothetical protein
LRKFARRVGDEDEENDDLAQRNKAKRNGARAGNSYMRRRASDIVVRIPVELTAAMIIRAGVIKNEARARELAIELHEIVAEAVKLYRAEKIRLVDLPCDPEGEPTVLEERRPHNALEVADFTLACWRQALVSTGAMDEDSPDAAEGAWISETLAAITPLRDPAPDRRPRWGRRLHPTASPDAYRNLVAPRALPMLRAVVGGT